ncbi:MAG TPA: sigma-70 family RNA polymerase sigma factor, partial [Bacteroidia bacterium]|nr:sigma-70 family RNA polymerase sigma factor [Bacteroidia bacterium]
MPAKVYSEEELVTALKKGDQEAMAVLYDNYSAALLGVIFRIVDSSEAAEDILQEVFIKIWKNISSYDRSKGKLFTWLINIARNAAIDSMRVKDYAIKSKIQSIDNSVRSINRQYNVSTQVDHIGLKTLVDKLKPEYKVLVDKLYFEGYTQEEAAEELGIPLGTVKTRIRAAINHLRE